MRFLNKVSSQFRRSRVPTSHHRPSKSSAETCCCAAAARRSGASGALLPAAPSFLLFGDAGKLPQTAVQWGVLVWMGLFATALGMFWWVKGSTLVDAGTLAIMNELHVPAGLIVNLLIWNRDAYLQKLALGGVVILASLWVNSPGRKLGRRMNRAGAAG